jgi:crotonobetainyl-CoA:carnitine CoA-transferase CaiB-like acyl-CoA transferase
MSDRSADTADDRVLPLAGIRVVDTATLLAGPLAATFLGEFGADVVKVEGPDGDPMREWPPHNEGESVTWQSVARNKRSLVMDLHDPAERSRLADLLRQADVFVTNFRVPTLQSWGLDYDEVRAINPRLVMLHVTGFGRTGPYRDRPGFARIAEAFAGLTYITGEPDRDPIFAGYPMGDAICGLYGAFSVMLALRARDLTGRGGLVDLGLYEPTLRLLDDLVPGYLNAGHVKARRGNRQDHSVPNGLFPTADAAFVVMPVSTPNMWDRLTKLIGDASLFEFDTLALRVANRETIDAAVAAFTRQHTADELVTIMAERGIACGKINSARDIAEDPHVQARGNFVRVPGVSGAEVVVMAPIPASDLFRGAVRWTGPPLGMPEGDDRDAHA